MPHCGIFYADIQKQVLKKPTEDWTMKNTERKTISRFLEN
jgi:hypothetical protein